MKDYRILFEKRGISKYISHLDLNRCMIRAIRRSGLPAWYTEGFHPHLYLMFPLALPLGTESICEIMDFRLMEELPPEEILQKLNAVLPEGLHAIEVREPQNQAQEITEAEYLVRLSGDNLSDLWNAFICQSQILIQKRTKKGMKEIDIKPMLTCQSVIEEQNELLLSLLLPAGNEGSLNISAVTDAFQNYADKPIFIISACRIKIFCRNQKEFL